MECAESNKHYHQNYYCIISEKNLFGSLKSDKNDEGVEEKKIKFYVRFIYSWTRRFSSFFFYAIIMKQKKSFGKRKHCLTIGYSFFIRTLWVCTLCTTVNFLTFLSWFTKVFFALILSLKFIRWLLISTIEQKEKRSKKRIQFCELSEVLWILGTLLPWNWNIYWEIGNYVECVASSASTHTEKGLRSPFVSYSFTWMFVESRIHFFVWDMCTLLSEHQ